MNLSALVPRTSLPIQAAVQALVERVETAPELTPQALTERLQLRNADVEPLDAKGRQQVRDFVQRHQTELRKSDQGPQDQDAAPGQVHEEHTHYYGGQPTTTVTVGVVAPDGFGQARYEQRSYGEPQLESWNVARDGVHVGYEAGGQVTLTVLQGDGFQLFGTLPQSAALSELFEETRSSVPGLTSMLKDEPDQYRPVFTDVFEQTLSGEQQALQGLPAQLDLESATLEFIEGGLVAGSFGGMLRWTSRGEVDGILEQARQLVATGEAPQALAEHQARAEAVLTSPDRTRLHEGFLEGVWVGALEAALYVGP